MTFRKLLMLGGIGGLVYAHRKRGGQMTLESFKQSGRDLIDGIKSRANDLRQQAEQKLHDANVGSSQSFGSDVNRDVGSAGSDVGYGSSGFDYNRNR
jgi:hypothetical protein